MPPQKNKKHMNNFDISSTGVNIEVHVTYSTDMQQIYFDDTFHVCQYSGPRSTAALIYDPGVCGKITDFDDLISLVNGVKYGRVKELLSAEADCRGCTISALKQEIADEFKKLWASYGDVLYV